MSTETINKPQVAIDAGLLTRDEAAQYLGLKLYAFDRIAKQLAGVKLGGSTFYSKYQLQAYLAKLANIPEFANIQQSPNIIPQSIEH